jgi:transposase-like protein
MLKTRAGHFTSYTAYNYCPRCTTGIYRRFGCTEDEAHGPHLHYDCQICGRQWVTECKPVELRY